MSLIKESFCISNSKSKFFRSLRDPLSRFGFPKCKEPS